MNWFKGEIVEAVNKSKSQNAIFVVYIEGKDEKSTKLTQLLDTEEICNKLGSSSFVAIKLEADSVPHQQFSEIYKQTPVPSIYFIGRQGSPLEIITQADNVSSLSQSLDVICQKGGVPIPVSTPIAGATASTSLINNEQSHTQVNKPTNVVCENGVCTLKKDSTDQQQNDENVLSAEEKVENAQKLIEMKREQKKKEEEEKERQKEIERRKMGQGAQQLKRWQEDQELKQMLEEREKEKREEQVARERVLAQIAQDRAERAARLSSSPSTSQVQARPQAAPQPPRSLPDVARIQFKLPDGSTRTQDFPSTDTLSAIHNFIKNNLNLNPPNYNLSTTFPRRQFVDEDKNKTLLDLELAPSAVILILPANRGTVATSQGFNWMDLFWGLLAPFVTIYGCIRNFVFGAPDTTATTTTNAVGENKRAADGPSETRPVFKRRIGGESTVVRRHGNVHGLADREDSDDENNTWNGNSTQQM